LRVLCARRDWRTQCHDERDGAQQHAMHVTLLERKTRCASLNAARAGNSVQVRVGGPREDGASPGTEATGRLATEQARAGNALAASSTTVPPSAPVTVPNASCWSHN